MNLEISQIAREALNKAKDSLTETYRKLLIGKEIYKTNKTNTKFIGIITDVSVERFTEYGDVVLTINTTGHSFNAFGCNLHDEESNYGWFYKSVEVK